MWRTSIVALALASALGACAGPSDGGGEEVDGARAAKLLVNRNWMDLWPTRKDQRLQVFRFTPAMGGGVYQDRTIFRGQFELFMFGVRGRELEVYLPETEERIKTRYRIEKVEGPEPFDLKLVLDKSPRGKNKVYYGRSVEGGDLDAELAAQLRE